MKTYNIWLLIIMAIMAVPLSAQNCFTRYFEEGQRYMGESNYEQAILNFLGTLNCPETALEQRQKAGAELERAINLNRQVLEQARDDAEAARDEAVQAAQRADMRYRAYLAQRELELGNVENGLTLAFQALELSHKLGQQDPEIEALFGQAVWASRARQVAQAGLPPVFNAENTLLVAEKESLRLYNLTENTVSAVEGLPSGKVLKIFGDSNAPYFLVFKEEAAPLVLTGNGNAAGLLTGLNSVPTAAAFSPAGHLAATGLEDGKVLVWRLPEGRLEATLAQGEGNKVLEVQFSPDGRRLLSRTAQAASLWDIGGASLIKKLDAHGAYLYQASFLEDGENLFTLGADGKAILWDKQGNQLKTLGENIQLSIVDPSRQLVLLADGEQQAAIWSGKGEKQKEFTIPSSRQGAFSSDGQHLLLWQGQNISVLDKNGSAIFTKTLDSQANDACFSGGHTHFLVGTEEGELSLWSRSGAPLLETQTGEVLKMVGFSPESDAVVAHSYPGGAWLCPTPAYEYERMKKSPPPVDAELLDKYGIK